MFSNCSGELNRGKKRWLQEKIDRGEITLKNLTFEMLEGTHLKWRYIERLVGKEVNSTREKRRIKEIYEQMELAPVEASGPELLQFARAIQPRMVIPIHTEHPQVFAEELQGFCEVRAPQEGEALEF